MNYPSDILLKSDFRYTSKVSKNSIDDEIKGLFHGNTFSFVYKKKFSSEADVLGGIFILKVEQRGTDHE